MDVVLRRRRREEGLLVSLTMVVAVISVVTWVARMWWRQVDGMRW